MKIVDTAMDTLRRAFGQRDEATIPAIRIARAVGVRNHVRLRLASSARFEPV